MFRVLLLVGLLGIATSTWSEPVGQSAIPSDLQGRCRYGAEQLIAHGEQSLLESGSRPQRIEKRRKLVEDWKTRLANNEDPCLRRHSKSSNDFLRLVLFSV